MSWGTLNTYRAGGYEREAKENLCPSRKVAGGQWEMAADAFAWATEFHLERLLLQRAKEALPPGLACSGLLQRRQ